MISLFLGPSLPIAEARALAGVELNPPAAMGDVVRALARGAKVIAIVDGIFERVPAVWHKEILFALSRGVLVYGAASMGALRAAECHAFGMTGIGKVFAAFRDGTIEDDDEVAVAHASAEYGYRAPSDAMVNIREAVREGVAKEVLSPEAGARLLRDAMKRFYADRHWGDVVRSAAWLAPEESRALLATVPVAPDVKRADARLLLEELRRIASAEISRHQPSFDFEPTSFWLSLLAKEYPVLAPSPERAVALGDETSPPLPRWRLTNHVRLVRPDRAALARDALLDLLVATASSRISANGDSFVATYAACADVEALRNHLDQAARALAYRFRTRLAPFLAVALARRGELRVEVERASRKWHLVAERGLEWPQLADAGVDVQTLSDWYEANFASLAEGGEAHALALGFDGWEEFVGELVAEFMSRRHEPTT